MKNEFFLKNFRTYGRQPYSIAVVHGGPGAAGEMAAVAHRLSVSHGVLEPLQTADSVEGQIEELRQTFERYGAIPMTVIGFSWGAWLAGMTAAKYPNLVKKLIPVSSGALEESYAEHLMDTRLSRLSAYQQDEVQRLMTAMPTSDGSQSELLKRFGYLMSVADTFEPIDEKPVSVDCNLSIFNKVWPQAHQMRKDGTLLVLLRRITCPVVAIHGDYDPTPVDGVRLALAKIFPDARTIVLEKCGHCPWREKYAREPFFEILFDEI